MGNITIGKYVRGNSIIHRLNPLVKLIFLIMFLVLIFITKNFVNLGIIFASMLTFFLISGLQKSQLFRILKPLIFVGIFLLVINMLIIDKNTKSEFFNYKFWVFTFNYVVLRRTILIILRIYMTILSTTLIISTTKPVALTRGIQDLLFPLKLIKMPVDVIAMIISVALRFIPTLLEETQRIMKAQASRGVDFKNGNIKTRAKATITLIIPLFVSAFSKAEDLGNAMETRGYDPYEKRTRYRYYPITFKDAMIFLFTTFLVIFFVLQSYQIIPLPNWWNFL